LIERQNEYEKWNRPEEAQVEALLNINEHTRTGGYNEISIGIVLHQTVRHPKWDWNIPSYENTSFFISAIQVNPQNKPYLTSSFNTHCK